jgi:hypothetical protein
MDDRMVDFEEQTEAVCMVGFIDCAQCDWAVIRSCGHILFQRRESKLTCIEKVTRMPHDVFNILFQNNTIYRIVATPTPGYKRIRFEREYDDIRQRLRLFALCMICYLNVSPIRRGVISGFSYGAYEIAVDCSPPPAFRIRVCQTLFPDHVFRKLFL